MDKRIVDIGVSFGPLRRFHDGLGEFSLQLGRRLAARAPELGERHGFRFHFHVRKERFGLFGENVRYVEMREVERMVHLTRTRFDLWHRMNQGIAHRPPVGTRCSLVTVHDLNYAHTKRGVSRMVHSFKGRLNLAGTDRVVTDTRFVVGDVRTLAGFRGPIDTIHLGARSLVDDPREPVAGIEPGGYLFHISRMVPSKNIGAILGLAVTWPEQQFVLSGPAGGSVDDVGAEVEKRGLLNVRVLRGVSEPEKVWLFANCAGFLFPSFTEGFGLPPLEAMHFGKPAFLSTLTCLPEIGGDVASYFRGFEPSSMRRVIEEGLAEARLPGRADAIRQHAARFSWDACADAYVALYLRLTGVSS
jgi:glycosyltransferase involved in cell wall biosynthesis